MSADPNEPLVLRGFLGWGNRKGGLEAYGPGGRWGGEKALGDRGYGDLLGDALDRAGATEGADLIVVAVSRRMLIADRDASDKIHASVIAALASTGGPTEQRFPNGYPEDPVLGPYEDATGGPSDGR